MDFFDRMREGAEAGYGGLQELMHGGSLNDAMNVVHDKLNEAIEKDNTYKNDDNLKKQ